LYTEARISLGMTYAEMGKHNLAENQLQIALWYSPLSVRARNVLGKLYLDGGQAQEALEQFRRSLEIEPNNPQAVAGLDKLRSRTCRGGPSAH